MPESDVILDFVEVNGHKFGKLSVRERSNILRAMKNREREEMLKNFRDSGTENPDVRYAELEALGRTRKTTTDFIEYVNSDEGQEEILLLSLRKKNAENPEMVLEELILSPGETMRLVAQLCGLEMTGAADKPAAKEGDAANPPKAEEPQALRGYGS